MCRWQRAATNVASTPVAVGYVGSRKRATTGMDKRTCIIATMSAATWHARLGVLQGRAELVAVPLPLNGSVETYPHKHLLISCSTRLTFVLQDLEREGGGVRPLVDLAWGKCEHVIASILYRARRG